MATQKHRPPDEDPGDENNYYPHKRSRSVAGQPSNSARWSPGSGSRGQRHSSSYENYSTQYNYYSPDRNYYSRDRRLSDVDRLELGARAHRRGESWSSDGSFQQRNFDKGYLDRFARRPAPDRRDLNGIPRDAHGCSPRSQDHARGRAGSQRHQDGDTKSQLHDQEKATVHSIGRYAVTDNRSQGEFQRQFDKFRDSRESKFANNPPTWSTGGGDVYRRWEEPSRWLEENIKPGNYIGEHRDSVRQQLMSPQHGRHPAVAEELQRSVGDGASQSRAAHRSNRTSSLAPYLEMMTASLSRNLTPSSHHKRSRYRPAKPRGQCQEPLKGKAQAGRADDPAIKLSPPDRVTGKEDNCPESFLKSETKHRIKSRAAAAKKESEREALFSRLIFPSDGYQEIFDARATRCTRAHDLWD